MVVIDVAICRSDDELHLARIPPPRSQQTVRSKFGGGVIAASQVPRRISRCLGDRGPEHWRGVQQEQVDISMCGQRSEDLELAGGESGQSEQREPFRKVRDRCVVKEPITCALPTL